MRVDHARVRELAAMKWTDKAIAKEVGCHPGYARLIRTGRIKSRADGGSKQSREQPHSLQGASATLPSFDHPALMNGKTLFPSTVASPVDQHVLKPGGNNVKLGSVITKGKWKRFPIYAMTLEERATCPTSCKHWRSCLGNGSNRSTRYAHGPALEHQITVEVARLQEQHHNGFAVRLHTLGDFYSVGYVQLWRHLIETVPQLHVFGFTARTKDEPIGRELRGMVRDHWDRFAIRMSNGPDPWTAADPAFNEGFPATISIEHPFGKPDDAVICPAQLGKTDCCAECALCWNSKKRVAFLQH